MLHDEMININLRESIIYTYYIPLQVVEPLIIQDGRVAKDYD